jgi:hypothetical protein
MKKRKSKTKKGRSPSMAARVKKLIEHADDTAREITSLKQRVSDLENAKTEPDSNPESAKSESVPIPQ